MSRAKQAAGLYAAGFEAGRRGALDEAAKALDQLGANLTSYSPQSDGYRAGIRHSAELVRALADKESA